MDEIKGLDSLFSSMLLASRTAAQLPHGRACRPPHEQHGGGDEEGGAGGDLTQSRLMLDDDHGARGRGLGTSSLGASSASLHSAQSSPSGSCSSNQMTALLPSVFHSALGHSVSGEGPMEGTGTVYRPGEDHSHISEGRACSCTGIKSC